MTAAALVPFERLPPHDIEAEEALVAALMVDPDVADTISRIVVAGDFFREKNRWVYEAALSLHEQGEVINQITVAHTLAQRDRLEGVGGQTWLAETIRRLPTSIGIEFYARIVQRQALYRAAISAGTGIAQLGYQAPDDPEMVLRYLEERAADLRELASRGKEEAAEERMAFVERLEEFMEAPRTIRGVRMGYHWLDLAIDGLVPGSFTTIGGTTSIGKSAFVQNVTRNCCRRREPEPVLLFSVEMSREEVRWRLVFMEAGVDPQQARSRGSFTPEERARVRDAEEAVALWPVTIVSLRDPSLAQIRSEIRRFRKATGGTVVIIDHIGFVSSGQRRGTIREEMVEITRAFKRLPGEEEIALVATSHVSREGMRSADWLRIGDLKESGSIENDSDGIILLTPCHGSGCPCGYLGDSYAPLPKETQTFEKGRGSGEWETRLGASAHIAKWGWVHVMADAAKVRMGTTTRDTLRFDWWNQGGRFIVPRPEGGE